MAASERLKVLHVSLASSSSVSSVRSEISFNEYSEDFHSSSCSSVKEIQRETPTNGEEMAVDGDDSDDITAEFLDKKLKILKENRPSGTTRPTERKKQSLSPQTDEELNPFWLKKLQNLQKRSGDSQTDRIISKQKLDSKPDSIKRKERGIRKQGTSRVIPESIGNEIGLFQGAFERMKFENLRFKCRQFIECNLHSPRTCSECIEQKQRLAEAEFYKKRMQIVKQKDMETKLEQYVGTRSSALLIAKIIKDGPKPSWNSKELWNKVLAGGYKNFE